MLKIGKQAGQNYTAAEVAEIRKEIPYAFRRRFPLRGETGKYLSQFERFARDAAMSKDLQQMADEAIYRAGLMDDGRHSELARQDALECEKAKSYPTFYPVSAFIDLCRDAALNSVAVDDRCKCLEKELSQLCVDKKYDLDSGPWYFAGMVGALREYQRDWQADKAKVVVTSVGEKVYQTLDATQKAGGLGLLIGKSSLGQYFAARAWCEQYPGRARCVDVPPSNDEASFYRAIARALGLGNFTNYKNVQIRDRVEVVLRSGAVMLVLNHAQNLWPQKNLREAFPGRLAWLLDQVDQGASACMISGPQFFMQKRACEKTGWDSPELQEKIFPFEHLPESLELPDILAVARVLLPAASEPVIEAVALYSFGEDHYLAGLERVAKRAKIQAATNGRGQPISQDIHAALKFVSGSDALLRSSFSPAKSVKGQATAPALPTRPEIESPALSRETRPAPAAPAAFNRRADSVELLPS